MSAPSSISVRRKKAVESFKSAADCIGTIEPEMALFAITRGQFSMIDATLACLDQVGKSDISIWTWTIAEYEIECMKRLMSDDRIGSATLIIDAGARNKNAALIGQWKETFGISSVRYVVNHAKIVTIQNKNFKLLLRGSMNLNFNPRFEQFDITEGGCDFDLVKQLESELPILSDNAKGNEVYKASKVADAFEAEKLKIFSGVKVWAK
jgi:hypothetical protein